MDDRAFDMKLDAMHANRRVNLPNGFPVSKVLERAVPFLWTDQALMASDEALRTFPQNTRAPVE